MHLPKRPAPSKRQLELELLDGDHVGAVRILGVRTALEEVRRRIWLREHAIPEQLPR